jgi:hypothetical protein
MCFLAYRVSSASTRGLHLPARPMPVQATPCETHAILQVRAGFTLWCDDLEPGA